MKRIMSAGLMVVLLGLGSARFARAHGDGEKEERGAPGEFSQRMRERLKENLELSDEQSKKLDEAFKSHADAVKPLHEKMKDGMKKLHEQVEAKASDKEIEATLASLDDGRKAMDAERRKLEDAFAKTLKPIQRAKMRLAVGKMMMHGRGRRGGHGRGDKKSGGRDEEKKGGDDREGDGDDD